MSSYMPPKQRNKAFPPRGFEATASPPPMPTQFYVSNNGIPYHFKNGTAFFQPPQLQAAPMPVAAEMYPGAAYMPAQAPQAYAPMMYPNPQPVYISNQYPQQYQPLPMQNPMMFTQQMPSLNNGTDTPSPISMSPHGTPPYFVPPPAAGEYYMPQVPPGQYPPYGAPPVMVAAIPEQPALQYCTDAPAAVDQPSTFAPAEANHQNHQQPQQQYRSLPQLQLQAPYMPVQPMQVQAQSGANAPQPRRYQNSGGRRSHTHTNNSAHHAHARKREGSFLDNGAAGDGCNQHAPPSTLPGTPNASTPVEQELCSSLKGLNVQ